MQSPLIANQDDVRVAASPLARRMAEHAGLDLTKISGSGPNGRIIKADIDQVLSQDNALKLPPVSTVTSPSSEPSAQYDAIPNNSMRKVIDSRLT